MIEGLEKREIHHGQVTGLPGDGFQLTLPVLTRRQYCLAQLDDYMHLPRRSFPYQPPLSLHLDAKVSGADLPGTWGFGLWNDPFSLGFIAGGVSRLLPVLPNAAWFFYASKENYLSLWDDAPASGFHVKTFRSPLIPSCLSIFALPFIPLLLWPAAAGLLRRSSRALVRESGRSLQIDVRDWHAYGLLWEVEGVSFTVDGEVVHRTELSPRGRMGLVIWIDNQYFRFDPQGKISFGSLRTDRQQSLAIRNLVLDNP